MEKDKRYGLQLRVKPAQQKKPPTKPPRATPSAFLDDGDDNVETEISRQAYKNKTNKDVEEQYKKTLEEDPMAFDYDGVYDDMKQQAIMPRAQERQERKSKYIQTLMEKAKQREREREVVYEKKLAKERTQEDHLYADKDKFVTGAYKRKLAEQAKWLHEERIRELREERDDVTKKTDITDFYFSLSKNVAFGGGESQVNKTGKLLEEAKVQSPEKVGASEKCNEEPKTQLPEKAGASNNEDGNNSSPMNKDDLDASPASFSGKKPEEEDAQPVSDVLKSEEGVKETPASEQPKPDHHKKKEDALAAAKERFLARKKAKIQMDL